MTAHSQKNNNLKMMKKLWRKGSSNDSDEEKDDDTKAKKNLEKSYNKHVVNNQAGDDCFFCSVSVALYKSEDQFENVRERHAIILKHIRKKLTSCINLYQLKKQK
jgi:hypothetical protein